MNTNHLLIAAFAFLAGICFAVLVALSLPPPFYKARFTLRAFREERRRQRERRQLIRRAVERDVARQAEREARQRQGLETREIVQTRTGRVCVEFCREDSCTRCDTPSPQGHTVAPTSVQYLSARREFLREAHPRGRALQFQRYCDANRFGPRGISDDTQ